MTVDAKQPAEQGQPQLLDDALTLEQLIEKKSYHALKNLLLSEESERLNSLEHYLHHPQAHAEKIAPSLPDAIKQADLAAVYQALELNTVIQNKIIDSLQNNPDLYAEALYPVIFPAIKKAIAEAFKEMMQSINYAIEEGLSLNRLSWHFEAMRSGLPYREILLRHTLTYRVEQVFLIHRESGLLIRHLSSAGVDQLRDSDAVSAMLTAIQDFIKDSFSVNEDDYLDTIEIGNYTVFLTHDSYAVLACVIQGIAPYALRETFNTTLQTVHKNYGSLLKNFDGDSSALEPTDPILETCLVSENKSHFEKKDPSIKNFIIILVLLLAGLGYWRYDYWHFQRRCETYISALEHTAGVIIANYSYNGKHLIINGLYDPLAENPQHISQRLGLQNQELSAHWQAYQSLEPFFVEQRIKNFLQLPSTVNLKLDNLHLILQGEAPLGWMQVLPKKLAALAFLQSYDIKRLIISEEKQFQQLASKLERSFIYFPDEKATPTDTQQKNVSQVIEMVKQLQKLSVQLNKPITIIVTGHTDSTGTVEFNQALAQKRAGYMIEQLRNQNLSINLKKSIQTTTRQQQIHKDMERKISLKVIFSGANQ